MIFNDNCKNFFLTLVFLFVMIFFNSCNNENSIYINLKVENVKGKKVELEKILPSNNEKLQAKTIKNEECVFEIKEKDYKNCFYRLTLENESILLYLSKNEDVAVMADYPDFAKSYKIENSINNELIKKLNAKMLEFSDTVKIYENRLKNKQLKFEDNTEWAIIETNRKIKTVFDAAQNYLDCFIKENYTSPVIYLCLYQYVIAYPLLTIDNNFEVFKFVCENLEKYNPDLEQLLPLKSIVERKKIELEERNKSKILKVGDMASDFEIKDCNGKMLSLSQFLGKQIILFFWASWNNNSIKEIPEILKIKKEKNMEIIFFSLDDNYRSWNNCLKDLNIKKMSNVCDFKTWESPVVKIYGLKNIPYYVLIDETGTIVETHIFESQ